MSELDTPTPQPPPPSYRQRLVIYVAWHSLFRQGAELALRLYNLLMRDSQQPIARGMGIPVYFRSVPASGQSEAPAEVPLDEAHHTAVVALVDDQMALHRDNGWAQFLTHLKGQMEKDPDRHRLLPVMFSDHAFSVAPSVDESNFIRPVPKIAAGHWPDQLLSEGAYSLFNSITHELCRLLLSEPRLKHNTEEYLGKLGKPVQIFISHAKKDGAVVAEAVRDYVGKNLQLKTFFDVNDIPFGSEFRRVLEGNVDREHTAVLVIQTDEYSTREWCQREVLWAKKYERPVLILHGVRYGEKCSFPYLGNAPTIRFDPDKGPDLENVLGQLLVEVLRNVHFRQNFEDLHGLFQQREQVRALPQTPELLTLLELKSSPQSRNIKTVVYPEPPLGEHLVEVLHRFAEELTVTTPVLLLTSRLRDGGEKPLTGQVVGLSIGDSPDLGRRGFHKIHLDDASMEFARYLLESGANLAYGGDLRPGGFTEILRDVVWTYDASENTTPRLQGYLAWPYHKGQLKNDPAYLNWMDPKNKNRTEFIFVPLPDDLDASRVGEHNDRSPYNLLSYARCLTGMRQEMNQHISARVLLGGRLTGFMGRYPGIAEEALLAKETGKPLYLVGGLGGCARAVAEAIIGETPEVLTEAYQFKDEAYRTMVQQYKKVTNVATIDYKRLIQTFSTWGLTGLSASNGLTAEENLRLFETPHVIEMIYLVLKGLIRISQPGTTKANAV